jgi:hypothetical protein
MQHVKIAADKQGPAQTGKKPTAQRLNGESFANLREAIFSVVRAGIKSNLVPVLSQSTGKTNTLPFATPLDQQFVNNYSDVHAYPFSFFLVQDRPGVVTRGLNASDRLLETKGIHRFFAA